MSSNTIDKLKKVIIIIYALLVLVSVILSGSVEINYDISRYLDDDTETKISLQIMQNEFLPTADIQVMVKDVTPEEAESIRSLLADIPHILTVNFDAEDENYYKNGTALFMAMIDDGEFSQTAKTVLDEVRAVMERKYPSEVFYGGMVTDRQDLQVSIQNETLFIFGVGVIIVTILLLLSATSWIEPLILLATSGISILINMGTNVFLGEISYITNSVASILQLALSIDYSIVLIHEYQRQKALNDDNQQAMWTAVKTVVRPVFASALTTIAGLLALLFMSFTIGFDIGVVLMKGIFISFISSVTLLPALLLCLDDQLGRTRKRSIMLKGKFFVMVARKASKVIVPIMLVVIIVAGCLQGLISFSFNEKHDALTEIQKEFGFNNGVILVYPNTKDAIEQEREFIELISEFKKSDGSSVYNSHMAYSNTIAQEYDVAMAAKTLGVGEDEASLLFGIYHLYHNENDLTLTLDEFIDTTYDLLENDADVKEFADESTKKSLDSLVWLRDFARGADDFDEEIIGLKNVIFDALELPEFLRGAFNQADLINLIEFVIMLSEKNMITGMTQNTIDLLKSIEKINVYLISDKKYSYKEMAGKLAEITALVPTGGARITEDIMLGVYVKHLVNNDLVELGTITAGELVHFIDQHKRTNSLLASKLTKENIVLLEEAKQTIKIAEDMLSSKDHSRMILNLNLALEGEDTEKFVPYLAKTARKVFGSGVHFGGEIICYDDLRTTFDRDNTIISIFTIVSIFLIIAILFKSLSLPILLVSVIQGAVWISMLIFTALGESPFFMSYIIFTCILMGATIDYGILMSTTYVNARRENDKNISLRTAINTALPTVFSSGLILVICGFVIGFIATQKAISSVGLLLGVGALLSALMVLFVLPSILYLLDGFLMKLTKKQ